MKGSYSTPTGAPMDEVAPANDGSPFTYTWQWYSNTESVTIDPTEYAVPRVAAALARTWHEVLSELGRNETNLTTGLRDLLRLLGELPLTDEEGPVRARRSAALSPRPVGTPPHGAVPEGEL